jgi:hypothetical protein
MVSEPNAAADMGSRMTHHPREFVRRFVPPFITAIRTHYKHQGTLPRILNPQTFNDKLFTAKSSTGARS